MNSDHAASSETRGRLIGLALCVLLFSIYLVFSHYGEPDKGFVAVCVAAVFCAVGYVKRASLKQTGLAVYLVVFFLVQLIAVIMVKLPSYFPGAAMLLIAFADLFLVLWVGSFFESS